MALKQKSKQTFKNMKDTENFSHEITNFDTKTSVEEAMSSPTPEKTNRAIQAVYEDNDLVNTSKKKIKQQLLLSLFEIYPLENISEDYETLKNESKELLKLSEYSFIAMAKRLKIIKDKKLFLHDKNIDGSPKYLSFKDFIINEMSMSKALVYSYIGIYETFNDKILSLEPGHVIEYTKMRLLLPIFKAKDIDSSGLKEDLWEDAQTKSYRDLEEEVTEVKQKLGIVKPRNQLKSSQRPAKKAQAQVKTMIAEKNNVFLIGFNGSSDIFNQRLQEIIASLEKTKDITSVELFDIQ